MSEDRGKISSSSERIKSTETKHVCRSNIVSLTDKFYLGVQKRHSIIYINVHIVNICITYTNKVIPLMPNIDSNIVLGIRLNDNHETMEHNWETPYKYNKIIQ